MPLGIDELTAQPRAIDLGGRSLRLSPLTLDDLGVLQAWIYSQLPDPHEAARRMGAGAPADVQSALFREAAREDRAARAEHRIGMPEATALIQGLFGVVEVLYLATRRHHPDLAKDDLPSLIMAAGAEKVDRVTAHAFGLEGDGDDGDAAVAGPGDPKGRGAAPENGRSTSSPSSSPSRAATGSRRA
jgi:hypothetical protein